MSSVYQPNRKELAKECVAILKAKNTKTEIKALIKNFQRETQVKKLRLLRNFCFIKK